MHYSVITDVLLAWHESFGLVFLMMLKKAKVGANLFMPLVFALHKPYLPNELLMFRSTLAERSRSPGYNPMACLTIMLGCNPLRLRSGNG